MRRVSGKKRHQRCDSNYYFRTDPRTYQTIYILRSENARLAKPLPGNDFLLSQCKRSTRDRRYESKVTDSRRPFIRGKGDDDD